MQPANFKEIALQYRTIFFDAFGVLKNHQGILPGIRHTLSFLEKNGINYYILTNDSSRGPQALADGYQQFGIRNITDEKIISSGMLARNWLHLKIKDGLVAYLGTPESAHYIEEAGLETIPVSKVDPGHASQIKCMVFLDEEGFDWPTDLNKTINLLRRNNMPVIVANTDMNYPVSQTDIAVGIGGLADMIEKIIGKRFIRFGKPDAQMFMFAYEKARIGTSLQRDEILMVGDTLYTDIIGGNKFGLDTVLVLSGNTLPDMAQIRISGSGIIPTHICPSVLID